MTYVVSDIHGNLRRFRSVLKQIRLQPEDTLYILGDVIDRHPDGIRILRMIMDMPNAQMLLGNHEFMMLRALGDPYDGIETIQNKTPEELIAHWYRNGGDITHYFWKHQRKTVRAQIIAYLKALPLNLDVTAGGQTFKLVHGAPLDTYELFGKHLGQTKAYFAVWNRKLPALTLQGEATVIFGHTPTEEYQEDDPLKIWHGDHMIGIDCGGGYPEQEEPLRGVRQGRLACLRLDDMREFYSGEGICK